LICKKVFLRETAHRGDLLPAFSSEAHFQPRSLTSLRLRGATSPSLPGCQVLALFLNDPVLRCNNGCGTGRIRTCMMVVLLNLIRLTMIWVAHKCPSYQA